MDLITVLLVYALVIYIFDFILPKMQFCDMLLRFVDLLSDINRTGVLERGNTVVNQKVILSRDIFEVKAEKGDHICVIFKEIDKNFKRVLREIDEARIIEVEKRVWKKKIEDLRDVYRKEAWYRSIER